LHPVFHHFLNHKSCLFKKVRRDYVFTLFSIIISMPPIHLTTSIGTPPRKTRLSLLPTLFDRLQDDDPTQTSEPPSTYTHTPETLRESIRRDLSFLFSSLDASGLVNPDTHPHAAWSCLNFGMAPLAGVAQLRSGDWEKVENMIRLALQRFEPRLDPLTLAVAPLPAGQRSGGQGGGHLLRFEIRAQINTRPYPLDFQVQSAIDLETRRLGDLC